MIATNPQIVVVRADLPVKSLQELAALVKANPDKTTAGTAGVGAASHVGGIYFEQKTGGKLPGQLILDTAARFSHRIAVVASSNATASAADIDRVTDESCSR